MPTVKHAVIAAAGIGRRIGKGMPKCLIEVNGRPIIEYQLSILSDIPEIRMVVGFEDERVIRSVINFRRDVIFVRNVNYQSTTTLQSYAMGCKGINDKVLLLDGDMIISNDSMKRILQNDSEEEFICVATDISVDPVYAKVEDGQVLGFGYDTITSFEWANMTYIESAKIEYRETHLFPQLEKYLPKKALLIDRLEVDTIEDLEHANTFIQSNPDFCRI